MSSPADNYVRRILAVKEVHDGDTFRFLVDQGVGDARDLWVRLKGIDTWEMRVKDPRGAAARDSVETFLRSATEIVIQTFKTKGGEDVQTFIRYVADVWVDGQSLKEWISTTHPEHVKQ